MKKVSIKVTFAGLILLGFLSSAANQCSGNRSEGSLRNAIIWRISGNDLPSPSFLFGTVHAIDSGNLFIHATVAEQLRRCDRIVFESDLSDPQYQQRALSFAMMENDSLDGLLTRAEYEALRAFFHEEFNFPLDAVKKMKPFYLASLIGALNADGNNTSHEEKFMRMAREEGIGITGISTLEKESAILSGIELKDQVAYLLDEVESYKSGHSEWLKNEIIKAYQNADIEKIYVLMSGSLANHPSLFEQMFVQRNVSWIPAMIDLMKDQSCFFAVGVGHLPGESGLISLLRKRGYKVRPVRMDFWFHSLEEK